MQYNSVYCLLASETAKILRRGLFSTTNNTLASSAWRPESCIDSVFFASSSSETSTAVLPKMATLIQKIAEYLKRPMAVINAKWGCVVALAAWGIYFSAFGTLYSIGIILVELREEFLSGTSETTWIGSIAIAVQSIGTLLSSPLIRRFQNRRVATVGVFLCFGSVIMTSFMPILEPLYFTFGVVYGLGTNFLLISSVNLVLRYFPTKNCSRATVLSMTGSTVGMLAMNQIIHHLMSAFGWRNMLRVVGAILLIVMVPCVSTFSQPPSKNSVLADSVAPPDDQEDKPEYDIEENGKVAILREEKERLREKEAEEEKSKEPESGKHSLLLRILTYPELWFLSIGIMGCYMMMTFYYVSMVSFMRENGFEKSDCTLFMMVLAISEVTGKLLLSAFTDRLPFPKVYLFVFASIFGSVVMTMLLFATSMGMMLGLAVVTGMFVMCIFNTLPFSICVEVFGSTQSLDTSTVVIVMSGVGLVLGSSLGMSVDKTGNYNAAIFASIAIYCLSIVLYLAVPLYQRLFAKERYVMVRNRRKALLLEADGPERTFDPSPLPNPEYIFMDFVSVV